MIKTLFQFILGLSILFIIVSCKVTEGDIIGKYELKDFPKTVLQINPNKTFEFVKIHPNPYLHPFEHPEENFFITRGTWTYSEKKQLTITSQKDTVTNGLVKINKDELRGMEKSKFTFYDKYGDITPILYVSYSDKTMAGRLHGTMSEFEEDLTKRDTLKFHFYGYKPWTFISGENRNADYHITLFPEFKENYFNETEFRIKENKLIHINTKAKFKKNQNGM